MSNLQTLIGYQAIDKNLLTIEKELAATEEKKEVRAGAQIFEECADHAGRL